MHKINIHIRFFVQPFLLLIQKNRSDINIFGCLFLFVLYYQQYFKFVIHNIEFLMLFIILIFYDIYTVKLSSMFLFSLF